jgi:hypothetical protein
VVVLFRSSCSLRFLCRVDLPVGWFVVFLFFLIGAGEIASVATAPTSPASATMGEKLVAPADSLMANTPWCWAEPLQFIDIESLGYPESESTMGNVDEFSTWRDFGNL